AKDECEFGALAKNHQEDEEKDTPASRPASANRVGLDLLLDFFFQMPRNAVHPDDHRNHEDGGQKEEQSFKAVFANAVALEQNGDGQAQGGGRCNGGPDEPAKVAASGAGKVDKNDADNEGGFHTFAERDEKGREHGV